MIEQNTICSRGWKWSVLRIVLTALIGRLVFLFFVRPYSDEVVRERIVVSDAKEYHHIAVAMLEGRPAGEPLSRRVPGYPAFISMVYAVFGTAPGHVLLLQCILGSLSVGVLMMIGSIFAGQRASVWAGILLALDPHSILYATWLFTETLFVLVLLLSVYFLVAYIFRESSWRNALFSGLLCGASVMVRPAAVLLPVVYSGLILIDWKRTLRSRFVGLALFLAAFTVILIPRMVSHARLYGTASLSAQSGQSLLWSATYLRYSEEGAQRSLFAVRQDLMDAARDRAGQSENPFVLNAAKKDVALGVIRKNPLGYVKLHLRGMIMMLIHPDTKQMASHLGWETSLKPELQQKFHVSRNPISFFRLFMESKPTHEIVMAGISSVWLIAVYMAGLAGVVNLVRRRQWLTLFLIFGMAGYFLGITGPVGNARYRVPMMPFAMLLAGIGVDSLIKSRSGSCVDMHS
jgi:4-amino-4-deoxy-L-arabinose transferase-like glycosyltransferase